MSTIGQATRTGVGAINQDGIKVGTLVGTPVGTPDGIRDGIDHLGTTAIGIRIGEQAGIARCRIIMSAGASVLGQPQRRL